MSDRPTRFEILTAGFYLFVQAKRRPLAFLWLIVWSIALFAAWIGAVILAVRPLEALEPQGNETMPPEFLGWLFALIPLFMLSVALIFLVFYTGWNRFLTGARLPALIPFRLGADEGRSFVVSLVHMVLAMGAYMVAIIPLMMIMFALSAPFAFSENPPPAEASIVPVMFLFAVYFLLVMAMLAATVKFVPAYAMTIIEKRIVIFDSWHATKGVFWSAFVSTLIPIAFSLVLQVAGLVMQFVMLGASRLTGANSEITEWSDMADPAVAIPAIAVLVLAAVFWVIVMAMSLGPYAYMAVRHERNREVQDAQAMPAVPGNGTGEASA